VLDPAGLWEDLAEFLLSHPEGSAVTAESDGAGAGGSLVEGEDCLDGDGGNPVFAAMIV
jgi:hypothetical protein